ncbi:MAG: DUF6089 family protein, partial [Ginsengibacter sp.]
KFQLLFYCAILFSSGTFAQKIWINVYGGATNYLGDLQDKAYTFDQAHAAGGIGINYDLTEKLSVRTSLLAGRLSADDKYGSNKTRNLNFSSNLTEAQLGLQYHFTRLGDHSLTPYAFAGLAIYRFNPFTTDTLGTKYYLRSLSTEGQGFIEGKDYYNLTALAIPFGGGLKLSLSENINVGLEIGIRKLFTDYLDDVSTTYVDRTELIDNRGTKAAELAYRGDELKNGSPYPPAGTIRGSVKKDWYYFTALTLSFRLPGENGGGFGGRRSQFACPVNVR